MRNTGSLRGAGGEGGTVQSTRAQPDSTRMSVPISRRKKYLFKDMSTHALKEAVGTVEELQR